MAEINVTPLVDVMLVLLIIFMVTAPLLTAGVPIELPDSRANALDQDPKQVTVSIDREGYIYIDKDQVPVGGFPEALAQLNQGGGEPPQVTLRADKTLDYGRVRVATATMGFKHRALEPGPILAGIAQPNFLLKIIPHVDGTPRICELVRYHMVDVQLKGAWTGPASLELHSHALAPVAQLPVLEVLSARLWEQISGKEQQLNLLRQQLLMPR